MRHSVNQSVMYRITVPIHEYYRTLEINTRSRHNCMTLNVHYFSIAKQEQLKYDDELYGKKE